MSILKGLEMISSNLTRMDHWYFVWALYLTVNTGLFKAETTPTDKAWLQLRQFKSVMHGEVVGLDLDGNLVSKVDGSWVCQDDIFRDSLHAVVPLERSSAWAKPPVLNFTGCTASVSTDWVAVVALLAESEPIPTNFLANYHSLASQIQLKGIESSSAFVALECIRAVIHPSFAGHGRQVPSIKCYPEIWHWH